MQPLKIIIPGKYWDSQIYSGRLYLFTRDGRLVTYDWDHLIYDQETTPDLRLAMECGFRRSDYLYGSRWKLVFANPRLKKEIQSIFTTLSDQNIELTTDGLKKYELGQQDNPFPFPHADTTIYYRKLYSAGQSGLYQATCNKRTRLPVGTRRIQLWDRPTFAIAASYRNLAVATGSEGLWEIGVDEFGYDTNVGRSGKRSLWSDECDDCEWMFYSIYGTAFDGEGFLASFKRERNGADMQTREFDRIVSGREIFGQGGFSFGTRDKIYSAASGLIKIARYLPWDREKQIEQLGAVIIEKCRGEPISGGVASFGVIIEYDNALIVLPSEGKEVEIDGEPVNWRVFPRSKFYENQLHVIKEEMLVIYSFNHDYFVEQASKRLGSVVFDKLR